jgi:hypothetical protein
MDEGHEWVIDSSTNSDTSGKITGNESNMSMFSLLTDEKIDYSKV